MSFGARQGSRCHTGDVSIAQTDSLASKNRWLLAVAVLLVIPGTLLSVAIGGVGVVLLVMFLMDFMLAKATRSSDNRPALGVLAQIALAGVLAAAVGGVIALVAWVI